MIISSTRSGLTPEPTLANLGSVAHDAVVDGNAWATNTTGTNADYFPPTGGPPSLTFELDSPQTLTGFVYWGYLRSNGDDAGNEAKSFQLTFFDEEVSQLGALSFTADSPIGLNSREFSFPPISNVSLVTVTVTDNFFGDSVGIGNAGFNGNRVGLTEVRFVNRPEVIVTTLADENDAVDLSSQTAISLREAISLSEPGSRITFDEDLSGGTIQLNGTQLEIEQNIVIDASDLTNGLTIDANRQSRVMEIQPGVTAALDGLTLTGGFTTGAGGAISNTGANLSLHSCTLCDNAASTGGGGIFNSSNGSSIARLSLNACTISRNKSGGGGGGGIFNLSGSSAGATTTLRACTLFDNVADTGGGGIVNFALLGSATLRLISCTLSGNSTPAAGGGISSIGTAGTVDGGTANSSLTACTLTNNTADETGGGIFRSSGGGSSVLNLIDTIVAENSAPDGPDLKENIRAGEGITNTMGNNLFADLDGTTLTESTPGLILATDPILSPLGHFGGPTKTIHPLAGSPAILTGDDVTRTDQRGFTLTGPPTIGAVKLGAVTEVSNEAGLRQALLDSAGSEGQVIRITSNITLGADGQLVVLGTANGLFIEAPGLTIDANGTEEVPRRVMEIQPGATATLHGLTLTGGFSSGNGGAILNNQATLSLSACTLSGNSAGDNGGGIFSDGRTGNATLSLSSCTLSGNSAESGGGGIFGTGGDEGSATLSLSACSLSDNSAVSGGGIFSDGRGSGSTTLRLSACTLSSNSVGANGGGIFSTGSSSGSATLSLSACTLSGNSAESSGGGIFSDGAERVAARR